MAETGIRRGRAFWFFLAIALTGGLLQIFGEPRSVAAELGAILLLACFFVACMLVFYFAKKRARLIPMPLQFDAGAPFVPHVLVDVTLRVDAGGGAVQAAQEHRGIFVVGEQGFTARFKVAPDPVRRAGVPLRVEAQFLRPEVALPHFAAGRAFALIKGRHTVGNGEVVKVLDTGELPES